MARARHALPPAGTHAVLRAVLVLAACLGLAGTTLAASGGAAKDPAGAVLAAAAGHLGDTYTWGATGPDTWDCSGFTSVLWREVGGVKDIPRTSSQQQAWAVPIPLEQVLPGDLFFYGDPVSHVGLVEKRSGTTVTLVDASSSRSGVVRRTAWSSGVVRYGRVPRPGMTAVKPWTAPKPAPSATPSTEPARAALPAPRRPLSRSQGDAVGPQVSLKAAGLPPLAGLPTTQRVASTAVATKAVKLARAALGNRVLTDVQLVRNAWRRAGGGDLPASRSALTAAGRRVAVADARVGDLIVYAAPAAHVGVYVGAGQMVDASRSLGKVVLRQVWAAPGVQVVRLPG